MKTPRILMLFLDGVGIGRKNERINPFYAARLPVLKHLVGSKLAHLRDAYRTTSSASMVPVNATLGVGGLPQSGTGQTALLTGVNAAKLIGKHFGPYPYSTLKPVLGEKNIFRQIHSLGRSPYYANAFPEKYFDYINSKSARTPAISLAWRMSGFEINDSASLAARASLSADLTNERWNQHGFPQVAVITPQDAGRRLVSFTNRHDFVLFEYSMTDYAGHHQSMEEAIEVLETLDDVLEGILADFDHRSMMLIVTSDHGNIEDLSTKSHTRNPVPLLVVGERHRELTAHAKNLTHITPAIVRLLQ